MTKKEFIQQRVATSGVVNAHDSLREAELCWKVIEERHEDEPSKECTTCSSTDFEAKGSICPKCAIRELLKTFPKP